MENPLPLGAGALVVGLLQLRRIRDRERRKQLQEGEEDDAAPAPDWQVGSEYLKIQF